MMQQPSHPPHIAPTPGMHPHATGPNYQLGPVHASAQVQVGAPPLNSQPDSPDPSDDTASHSRKRKSPPADSAIASEEEDRSRRSPPANQQQTPPPGNADQQQAPPHPQLQPLQQHPHHPHHPQGQHLHPSFHFQVPPGYVPVMPVPVGGPVSPGQSPDGSSGGGGGAGRALNGSKRAEQNRKAQRAFRERRDAHVKALESRSQLLDAALASVEEANRRWEESRQVAETLRMENAQLRAALNAYQQAGAAVAQMQHQIAQQQQSMPPQQQQQSPPTPTMSAETSNPENKTDAEQVEQPAS